MRAWEQGYRADWEITCFNCTGESAVEVVSNVSSFDHYFTAVSKYYVVKLQEVDMTTNNVVRTMMTMYLPFPSLPFSSLFPAIFFLASANVHSRSHAHGLIPVLFVGCLRALHTWLHTHTFTRDTQTAP